MRIISDAPKAWKYRPIGSFIDELESGVSVNSSEQEGDRNARILKTSCVSTGRFDASESKPVVRSEVKRLRCPVRKESIVISRMNTPALVGASAYVPVEHSGVYLPDRLWQIVWKEKAPIDPRWLAQLLGSSAGRVFLKLISSGTSDSMKNISKDAFLSAEVPTPPLIEQREIANILSTWDEALEKVDALIAVKGRRKKALLQQLLAGKIRLKGHAKFKRVKLADVAEESAGRNGSQLDRGRLYAVTKAEGMVPMRERVQGATINRCKVVERGWYAYNPMRLNIGSIARWESNEPAMVSPDYVVFRTNENLLLSDYLNHVRRSAAWADFVGASGNGSVRVRIWFDDLGRFSFPLPTVDDQRAIAAILNTADEELRLLRKHRDAIDQQKSGLMQRLLTGKLRVRI
ncbi:MAG TPA: restriction endonuclease subunit S [Chthoniobacterales bacterium]